MRKYKIRILLNDGSTAHWTEEIITAKRFEVYRACYFFVTENDKDAYYPVSNTIINEI